MHHFMSQADEELVVAAKGGDLDAFEVFLRRHDHGIRALTARMLAAAWTEDVVQETYLKAFRALPDVHTGTDRLAGWLFRIAYRCALDELRRLQRSPAVSLESLTHDQTATIDRRGSEGHAADEQVVRRLEIEAALHGLRPEERAAIVLIDQLGFDYESAARVLEIPRGTVASRVNGARAKLRMSLSSAVGPQPRRSAAAEITEVEG